MYIYEEYSVSVCILVLLILLCIDDLYPLPSLQAVIPIETAMQSTPKRNAPRIVAFTMADKVQYFIGVEQAILVEVGDLTAALYMWFAAFYIFNLEYDKNAKSFGWFFQDVILGLPDSNRRAASYVAIVSDLKARLWLHSTQLFLVATSFLGAYVYTYVTLFILT